GQGEMHLQIAIDRLNNRYGLGIVTQPPGVPYKEAIRKSITQRSKFKRQTGGHGQFGDVVLDIKPLPRGSGFQFSDTIKGGTVPKQYIPSVEAGVKDYLVKGPLGFPVVDVAVTLTDGSFHTVDSSDLAFRTAGRMAMSEAMPQCGSVILEPVLNVEITIPSEYTSKANSVISSRRGQILGFDPKEGWAGWDVVHAHMPQSEVHDLIIDLRSLSHGVSTFTWEFDHLSELVGKEADQVLAAARSDDTGH
ncbi:MAG: elongation factor G, partial [Rhodospirillales bacterium]|nr:elongation factor G [Rhodospirillales bacterium]